MSPRGPESTGPATATDRAALFHRRGISYADTFPHPLKRGAIRSLEWLTAKPAILARIRRFERLDPPRGQAFWDAALGVMGIAVTTPAAETARIPATGPVVLVANHPHGLVDGMVLAALIGRVRPDYRILTRAILAGIDETAAGFMIPVPFPHEADSQKKMLEMRAAAQSHLAAGGLVALFPSGHVAHAARAFGPPVEGEWNVFTAKLIRTSRAAVVPVHFTGRNSRAYQIAAQISPTLRQGLLLHEILRAMDRPQRPHIGTPIPHEVIAPRLRDPRAAMAWLRARTLALGTDGP